MFKYIVLVLAVAWIDQGSSEPQNDDAIISAHDHLVSLRYGKKPNDYFFCGGSIIRPRWILTVAHCLRADTPKDLLSVLAGSTKFTEKGETYNVEKFIIHQNFSSETFLNDIALIKTTEDIKFRKKDRAINLPTTYIPGGVSVLATGWGYINYYRPESERLVNITQLTITQEQCQSKYQRFQDLGFVKYVIRKSNVCTTSRYGQELCTHDAGGSIIKADTLEGLMSFSESCTSAYPIVYTRAYSYLDWIQKHIHD